MRDELLAFFDAREEQVRLGAQTVVVRTAPDGGEPVKNDEKLPFMWQFVVRCTFDAAGALVFTDEDIPALMAKPRVKTARLLQAVTRVNGFDSEAEEKNSEAGPSSG